MASERYSLMAAACLLAPASSAQPNLRPVDAGFSDVSSSQTSERQQRMDFREPAAFERVYEIVAPDGTISFVRVSGALYAEFDQSWYNGSGEALVPPGTRFSIGQPSSLDTDTVTPNRAPNAVSLRADHATPRRDRRRSASSVPEARSTPVGTPSMASNELYRRVRITQLLRTALKPDAAEPQYAE